MIFTRLVEFYIIKTCYIYGWPLITRRGLAHYELFESMQNILIQPQLLNKVTNR